MLQYIFGCYNSLKFDVAQNITNCHRVFFTDSKLFLLQMVNYEQLLDVRFESRSIVFFFKFSIFMFQQLFSNVTIDIFK